MQRNRNGQRDRVKGGEEERRRLGKIKIREKESIREPGSAISKAD